MSDQDFFFDEDEPAKEEPKASTPKKNDTKAASTGKAAASAAPAGEQMVTMTITVLASVASVLVGVIIGIFIGRSLAAPVVPVGTGTMMPQQTAPQLSPEQLQGGELPPGHPQIGGESGDAMGGSGSATSSKSEEKKDADEKPSKDTTK